MSSEPGGRSLPELANHMEMRAHVARQDTVLRQNFAKDGHGCRRAKDSLPRTEALEHSQATFGQRAQIPVVLLRRELSKPHQCRTQTSHDVALQSVTTLVQVGRLRVDVNQRCVGHPVFVVELDRIVSYADHEVRLLMGLCHMIAQSMRQHSGVAWMVLRHHAFGHRRQHDGNAVLLGNLQYKRPHTGPNG